jgi:hypothetical protein
MASMEVRRRPEHATGDAGMRGGKGAPAATVPTLSPAATEASPPEESTRQNEAIQAGVEEIRRRYGSDVTSVSLRLEDRIGRRLGLAPLSAGAAVFAGLTGVVIRLAAALLVTGLAGQWAGIPWGRWALILACFGLYDAQQPHTTPPLDVEPKPENRRILAGWTALLPTIARESDVADLAAFTRRWLRLAPAAATGVAVAAVMLLGCWRVAPTALSELHPGSVVLMAFLLYDFGAVLVYGELFWWALIRRESEYDHQLFWASPGDSPEVRTARQKMPGQSLLFGGAVTLLFVLVLVLTSWDSPLVLPLGVGFLVIGYLTMIGVALGDRAAIRRIIERSRDQQLDRVQQQIEPYRSRYTHLTPQETEQLRGLLDLHKEIRDAPSTATTHTLWRTLAGLLLPTLVFALTVLAEVSAERLLDAILP